MSQPFGKQPWIISGSSSKTLYLRPSSNLKTRGHKKFQMKPKQINSTRLLVVSRVADSIVLVDTRTQRDPLRRLRLDSSGGISMVLAMAANRNRYVARSWFGLIQIQVFSVTNDLSERVRWVITTQSWSSVLPLPVFCCCHCFAVALIKSWEVLESSCLCSRINIAMDNRIDFPTSLGSLVQCFVEPKTVPGELLQKLISAYIRRRFHVRSSLANPSKSNPNK